MKWGITFIVGLSVVEISYFSEGGGVAGEKRLFTTFTTFNLAFNFLLLRLDGYKKKSERENEKKNPSYLHFNIEDMDVKINICLLHCCFMFLKQLLILDI